MLFLRDKYLVADAYNWCSVKWRDFEWIGLAIFLLWLISITEHTCNQTVAWIPDSYIACAKSADVAVLPNASVCETHGYSSACHQSYRSVQAMAICKINRKKYILGDSEPRESRKSDVVFRLMRIASVFWFLFLFEIYIGMHLQCEIVRLSIEKQKRNNNSLKWEIKKKIEIGWKNYWLLLVAPIDISFAELYAFRERFDFRRHSDIRMYRIAHQWNSSLSALSWYEIK